MSEWRLHLQAAREPCTPEQVAWDAAFDPINEQGLREGMSPGRAALRAMRLVEARRGPRPSVELAAGCRVEFGTHSVSALGGGVPSIPNRVGGVADEVLYERGEPAKETK